MYHNYVISSNVLSEWFTRAFEELRMMREVICKKAVQDSQVLKRLPAKSLGEFMDIVELLDCDII